MALKMDPAAVILSESPLPEPGIGYARRRSHGRPSKWTAVLVAAVLLWPVSPASADANQVEFHAPVPGSVLTPYWLDAVTCVGCNPDGTVRKTLREFGHEGPLFSHRALVEVCDRPFPPGAWDDELVGVAPEGAGYIAFNLRLPNELDDWDGAICAFRGPTTAELRADPSDTAVRWRLEGSAFEHFEDPLLGSSIPIDWSWPRVTPGVTYRLIAYNWAGTPTAHGDWRWLP